MPTLRDLAFGWVSSHRRDELALDSLVAAAKQRIAAYADCSVDDLRHEAGAIKPDAHEGQASTAALALFAAMVHRTIGLAPYDVQLRAAAAMALGRAVEMQTGEGKSLAVACAAAVLALKRRSVHVATVNQYLAERDYALFAPALRALGITVGVLSELRSPDETQRAYASSVVYGTGYAFGFDYLRERLRQLEGTSAKLGESLRRRLSGAAPSLPLQPSLDCAIVDELDSVLLDEAGTPLILSTPRDCEIEPAPIFERARRLAESLKPGVHFSIHPDQRRAALTVFGLQLVAMQLPRDLASGLRRPWTQYIEDALSAALLKRDVDYVVADGLIRIVDTSTGRIFDDRRWPEGLQRAVEFTAGVPFSSPTIGAARITRQRYFKLYRHLSGTSGTLVEAGDELQETYGSKITVVAPRLPSRLVRSADRIFRDCASRDREVVAEIDKMRQSGRPVLVGCRTIEVSKRVSRLLDATNVAHALLNGTQSAEEATIVAGAGRSGNVLVATNLAGRGTDIRLDDESRTAGGLHVIGVEYHDSARVDRQLLGRAGRQGDPGSGRFFTAADDAIWNTFPKLATRFRDVAESDGEIRADLTVEVRAARAEVEVRMRSNRRQVAAYDHWLDEVLKATGQAK